MQKHTLLLLLMKVDLSQDQMMKTRKSSTSEEKSTQLDRFLGCIAKSFSVFLKIHK